MTPRLVAKASINSDTKTVAKINALADQIRGDIWNRWMATAQKRALIWWRNRSVAPGLNARFTVTGAQFYGFGPRLHKPSSIKPYYHVTGSLQRALMKRKPKTPQASKNGGMVRTTLPFGGLSLNAMTSESGRDMRQIIGFTKQSSVVHESFDVGSYVRKTKYGTATVRAHHVERERLAVRTIAHRSGLTHAAIFGKFDRDAPVIQARVQVELRKILRASAYDKKTGKIKSSVISDQELRESA